MNSTIYVSADSNEIRAIIEKNNSREFVRGYNFTTDKLKFNGRVLDMTNFTIDFGAKIQRDYKLEFNPFCVVHGDLNEKQSESLIRKLVKEGLWVAELNGICAEHHFPTKYYGYQGGGFS